MRGLENKVIVVCAGGTGTNDGPSNRASIGGATARRLAQEGARVVVGDLSEPAAKETVALIERDGGTAIAQHFDASDESSVKALMKRAIDEFGGIDGVHANAMDMSSETLGVDGESDLLTLPLDVWQRTIDVGLTGFLLCARYSIPSMLERGGGSVVATVSGAVYVGEPIRLAYQTTKTGMTAMVRHIASRWGHEGIRANAVSPGMVPGKEKLAEVDHAGRERMMRMARSNRLGTADDIAGMVTFLMSDDGSWVTGQVLAVDGGVSMRP
ncbi:MAG TPA: SDR family oxidoreductase [Frankiaceae bacterium]|jgi:NAD(P)-dependent dehydrogenase (short-subunit alcohol dehydrogenase family)|nr:SDR family oxidoreductase [Frankiaceae bacterium]